jgi:hypothetical protein
MRGTELNMPEVDITYEIERKDFAEANSAILRASRWSRLCVWGVLGSGILLLVLPLTYKQPGTEWEYPYLAIPFAVYLFYLSILWMSPFLNGVLSYRQTNLAGKKYTAHFSPAEVRVSGEDRCWINQWRSFYLRRELKSLFLLYDGNTMFIFAKRYFTAAQMEDLRLLIRTEVETDR